MKQDLDALASQPYRVEVDYDPETGMWSASVPDLPGCAAAARSWQDLQERIEESKRAWIETALELGRPVPEPSRDENFSGRTLLRMPRSLHRRLSDTAAREGVSLNQLMVSELARAVGEGEPLRLGEEPAEGYGGERETLVRLHRALKRALAEVERALGGEP